MMTRLVFALMILMFFCKYMAAQLNADSLLSELVEKQLKVEDFEAKFTIDVDVDFIKMPVKRGKVFYKKPDKFKFKTAGFAMIPRQGLSFNIAQIMEQKPASIYVGSEDRDTIYLQRIKLVPLDPESPLVLASLWIDEENLRLVELEANTKDEGVYNILFYYSEENDYDLPNRIQVSFKVDQVNIPMRFMGNLRIDEDKLGEASAGLVTIHYKDYIVNQGLTDMFFEKGIEIGPQ